MSDWSEIEVEYIVADYFDMLSKELKGDLFNKTEHRRNLLKVLNNRTEGSIEFKHQNISAVLINLEQLYIKGYAPRYNYQKLLEDKVIEHLNRNRQIEALFQNFSTKQVNNPVELDFSKFVVEPPKMEIAQEQRISYNRRPIKINYLEREQINSSLGESGESLVLQFEKWRLISIGKEKLSEQVEWISKDQGDGAGFDILSKYENGKDKYIEVKTTKLSKEAPFYFSKGELDFSKEKKDHFHLYRLFNFEKEAKMFTKNGSLDEICNYHPINFKGSF